MRGISSVAPLGGDIVARMHSLQGGNKNKRFFSIEVIYVGTSSVASCGGDIVARIHSLQGGDKNNVFINRSQLTRRGLSRVGPWRGEVV